MSEKVVYFILAADTAMVKIGVTRRDPQERLYAMQTGSPSQLEVVLVLDENPPFEERQLHKRFYKQRSHGEWFRCEGELRQFIADKRLNPTPTFEDDCAVSLGQDEANAVSWKEHVAANRRESDMALKGDRPRTVLHKIEGYPSERGLPKDLWAWERKD